MKNGKHIKRVKCVDCKYTRPDDLASEGNWIAYECGNRDSEYYRCLLNISENGAKHQHITWSGCAHGMRG
jgi:hypothetical protein